MELKKFALASFAALSLVACGSGDDQSKPDEPKDKAPEKSAECVAAGDLCKLENGRWVIHKKDDNKPDDEVPAADVAFDYSQIGVTDKLEPEKKGFGFYHKGEKSPLDATWFKNGVTLSPNIPWSSTMEYDVDLWNFVAIRLSDAKSVDKKNPVKFMFDKIGETNQANNKNIDFFGKGIDGTTKWDSHSTTAGEIGKSSISFGDDVTYAFNVVPALVNSYMWKNAKGAFEYKSVETGKNIFPNQEEDHKSTIGSGYAKLRVYGRNAFLETDTAKANTTINPGTGEANINKPEAKYPLENRSGDYFKHVNYAWYDLSTFGKRKQKAKAAVNGTDSKKLDVTMALAGYQAKSGSRTPFPTDIELGELKNVQFGRLSGQGIDPEADDIPGYGKKNLKEYPFTTGNAAAAGNDQAEDWYFARGTDATPVDVLEKMKNTGAKISYDGQAVMFGLDYTPTSARKKPNNETKHESGQSTNSVKPLQVSSGSPLGKMLLDGKHNFVSMEWDPASGEISGRVYGVWTLASYWRNPGNNKLIKFSTIAKNVATLEMTGATDAEKQDNAKKYAASYLKAPIPKSAATGTQIDEQDIFTEADAKHIIANAIVLEPWMKTLVALKGKVLDGTNSFGGVAVRVKDDSKGLFTGGFFGPKGHEIGGVINSQTGDMKDQELTDPSAIWGGAFGAKHRPAAAAVEQEDLIFQDKVTDYMTSTEVFN